MNDDDGNRAKSSDHGKSENAARAKGVHLPKDAQRAKDAHRAKAEANAVFELHRLGMALSSMVSSYAVESGLNGRDAEALLMIWQAQLSGASLTASQLATRLGITRAASTYMLDRLEQRGYVQRQPDPSDRRKTLVNLSTSGHDFGETFVKARAPHQTLGKSMFPDRTTEEVALFADMLREVNDAMSRH